MVVLTLIYMEGMLQGLLAVLRKYFATNIY